MSARAFDLLPPDIARRVAVGRASRRTMLAAAAAAGVGVALLFASQWIEDRSMALLAEAQRSGAPVVAVEEEIVRLRAERDDIARRLERQREVGVAIPAGGVVGALAGSLPGGATLERLELVYEHVQGEERKVRRPARQEHPARMLRGIVSGIASDDADVARIVEGIGALAPVASVSLESSRSREFRGKSAREFRVAFSVELDRRWKLPEMTNAAADAAADEEVAP